MKCIHGKDRPRQCRDGQRNVQERNCNSPDHTDLCCVCYPAVVAEGWASAWLLSRMVRCCRDDPHLHFTTSAGRRVSGLCVVVLTCCNVQWCVLCVERFVCSCSNDETAKDGESEACQDILATHTHAAREPSQHTRHHHSQDNYNVWAGARACDRGS